MCGRYTLGADGDLVERRFLERGLDDATFRAAWKPTFSIAPTDVVPMVRERLDDEGVAHRSIDPARWDFRPHWRTERKPLFNARLETVAKLPTFRDAFKAQRAIVPMTGYFEWTGPKGDKTPHYIAGGDLLAAAGLWATCKAEDAWEVSTVVITREAVDAAGEVHERMPAFLTEDLWSDWLSPAPVEDATGLLDEVAASSQAVASGLGSWVVDRVVNSTSRVDRHDASVIEPVKA